MEQEKKHKIFFHGFKVGTFFVLTLFYLITIIGKVFEMQPLVLIVLLLGLLISTIFAGKEIKKE